MMKDITHYFQSPISANGRVANTETNQCFSPTDETNSSINKEKCIKTAVADELKIVDTHSNESTVADVTHKMPRRKRKRKVGTSFPKKDKNIPVERTNKEESCAEVTALPTKKESLNAESVKANKAISVECSTDKHPSTNAFHILMSPKTKIVVLEPAVEAEEISLTAVKENISVNTSGDIKLATRSKKRKKKGELEEENDYKNSKRIKYKKTANASNILGEHRRDCEPNSENDESNGSKAIRKQHLMDTVSEAEVESKRKVKSKEKKKMCNLKTHSKDKNAVSESSEDSGNRVSVIEEDLSSEKEVKNCSGKEEKNKQRKKNRLSLRTKTSPNLLRKHSSPDNSLLLSPETQSAVKTPNSLFKYFNRVNSISNGSEKLEVKALVHSPPVSPSVKMRTKMRQYSSAESRNDVLSPSRRVAWKLRVKLRTREEEDEITVVKDGEDSSSSDDHIFTPEKKIVKRKMSIQQQVASIVIKKAVVVLTKIKSPKSPLDIFKAAASPKKRLSPNKQKAVVNLAPLFTRAKCRNKKVDAAVIEARKNFLKSGVPEQVKRMLDIQRSMEEQEHYIFPTVAHVQQKDDTNVWNLPEIALPGTLDHVPLQLRYVLKHGELLDNTTSPPEQQLLPEKVTHWSYKTLLEGIKAAFPEFPVYRTFRRLRAKAAALTSITNTVTKVEAGKQKRRSKRMKKQPCGEESVLPEPLGTHRMWTEKYKPSSGQEVVGNGYSVGKLRKWLEAWKWYSEEAQKRSITSTKKPKEDASSGDEFVDSDSGGSETSKLPDNTAILVGPYGCGKTCTVYAIANELGFKVLEINSSSKRNGKRILSELQEATQSHQVQAKGEHTGPNLNSFFKPGVKNTDNSKKSKSTLDSEAEDEATSSRMSLILVEGVEVVYEEHDEGFISALNALVASSKRPVILVTSDPHCAHILRFMDHHLVLKFRQPPVKSLSVWLQLVCLLEGLCVSRAEIERLLDLNNVDVRRTLLQLQYWVLSGGDRISQNGLNVLPAFAAPVPQEPVVDNDEHSNISWNSAIEEIAIPENFGVVRTFVDEQLSIEDVPVSYPTDLDHIWWNFAPLLSLEVQTHRCSSNRTLNGVDGSSQDDPEVKSPTEENIDVCESPEEVVEVIKVKKCNQKELDALAGLMDIISHVDVFSRSKMLGGVEGFWKQPVKDGISLQQDLKSCSWQSETTSHNICNYLLEHGLSSCRNKLNSERARSFRLSRPSQQDLNWQVAQHANNKTILPAVPLWSHSQHRAVCSDYFPLLRTVIRYEKTRLAENTKRGNRFFHYLKGLNIHAGEATFNSLSQVFTTKH